MRHLSLPVLIALGTSLAACSSPHKSSERESVILSQQKISDRDHVKITLRSTDTGKPTITREETIAHREPRMGLEVTSISPDLARKLGVIAWKGVWTEKVISGSSASAAGMVPGDIVTSINEESLTSAEQYSTVLSETMALGHPVTLSFLRATSVPDGTAREERSVKVTPDEQTVSKTSSASTTLDASNSVMWHTGMQVAVIPEELSQKLYGLAYPTCVVSRIVLGSPAYLAGIRMGDRITSVDGIDAVDLDTIRRAVFARTRGKRLPSDETVPPGPGDSGTGPLALRVLGPLGAYETGVEVMNDVEENVDFHIPLIFRYQSAPDFTNWSFLDIIIQFGGNYNGHYIPSASRQSQRHSLLSLLPLGMFEFENGPSSSRQTYFWWITFRSES